MSSKPRRPHHKTLAFSPVFTIALGIGLPFVGGDKSYGQMTLTQTGSGHYGWKNEAESSVTASSTKELSIVGIDPTAKSTPQTTSAPAKAIAQSSDAISPLDPADAPPSNLSQAAPEVEISPAVDSDGLDGIAPAGAGQTISEIQVRFLDEDGQPVEGHTRSSIFRRELDLQPGTSYDPTVAQQGLERILQLDIVRDADIKLEPTADSDQVTLAIVVVERNPFVASFGTYSSSPSALQGPFQQNPVLGAGTNENTGLSADANLRLLNIGGNDQSLTFQLRGGERVFDTELSFTDPWIGNDPTGIAVNVFNQRSVQSVFTDGDRDIDLPNGNTPWVHRLGGGIQVFRPLSSDLTVALGTTYQRVSVHNSAFEDETFTRDELGERLVVGDSGYDDLLTINLSGDLDRRDNPEDPSRGSRFRFGIDQSIPIGEANIKFTRFSANYAQFIPFNLFGFAEGARTLVLNLQAGTILGDVPPYEAFTLSSGPVGDYTGNSFGTGSSFVFLGAEYRFPIANFSVFRQNIGLGGLLFGGYASALGTDDEVLGEPSISRDKPGEGWGYGIGLRARTDFGIFRLEFGLNDLGESQVIFTAGDRF